MSHSQPLTSLQEGEVLHLYQTSAADYSETLQPTSLQYTGNGHSSKMSAHQQQQQMGSESRRSDADMDHEGETAAGMPMEFADSVSGRILALIVISLLQQITAWMVVAWVITFYHVHRLTRSSLHAV